MKLAQGGKFATEWRNKQDFEEAYKVFGSKFIADMKELGTIVTINEGPAEVDKAKEIDYSKFNELQNINYFLILG